MLFPFSWWLKLFSWCTMWFVSTCLDASQLFYTLVIKNLSRNSFFLFHVLCRTNVSLKSGPRPPQKPVQAKPSRVSLTKSSSKAPSASSMNIYTLLFLLQCFPYHLPYLFSLNVFFDKIPNFSLIKWKVQKEIKGEYKKALRLLLITKEL